MTREEKMEKLKNCGDLAFPTVITSDMGLQYTVVTSSGYYTGLGQFSEWPVYKVYVNDSVRKFTEKIKSVCKISKDRDSELNEIYTSILLDFGYIGKKDFRTVISFFKKITIDIEYFWAFKQPKASLKLSLKKEEVETAAKPL